MFGFGSSFDGIFNNDDSDDALVSGEHIAETRAIRSSGGVIASGPPTTLPNA